MKITSLIIAACTLYFGASCLAWADASRCQMCHSEVTVSGPHGMASDPRTPNAGSGCIACHSDAEEHLKSPRKNIPLSYGNDSSHSAAERDASCLSCHEASNQLSQWHMSEHAASDVSCAGCHSIHSNERRAQDKQTQANACLSCHIEQRADLNKRSRHPVKEGLLVCTDCHSPHGSANEAGMVETTTNDTCFNCHAEKRGPFLYEHAPVADDCGNCHTPHGSVHQDLLTERTPFLCQQCHAEAFHPSTLYSGSGLPGNSATSNKLLADGCMNCHDKVHGSNHPSGPRLTR